MSESVSPAASTVAHVRTQKGRLFVSIRSFEEWASSMVRTIRLILLFLFIG